MASLDHDWYDRDLPAGVELGPRSWLYSSYAFLHCRSKMTPSVRLSADAGVYDGTMFELGPQGSVSVGRYSSVVAAVIHANGPVVIEDYALVSWNVHIITGPDEVPYPWSAAAENAASDSELRIASGAWVGAGATLIGASVGRNSIVGAGSVVREDVPPDVIVAGNPARVVASR